MLAALEGENVAQVHARRTVESSRDLVASIAQDEQLLSDFAADLGARRISRGEWLAFREPVEARLTENRRKLEQVAADCDLDDSVFDGLTADRWPELEFDDKRRAIRLVVDHVEVAKGKPGRNFDPTRIRIVPPGGECRCPR